MRITIPFKHFLFVIFLFQLLACNTNNGGEITYSNQTLDSTSSIIIDSNFVKTDTNKATAINDVDVIEDREESIDDFVMNGDYYATDPSYKLIIEPPTFEYFVGPQLKMKGNVSKAYFNEEVKIVFTPFGKIKKEMVLPTNWADDYRAIWVIMEGDTFYRQIRVQP